MDAEPQVRCRTHHQYKARKKPSTDCKACWEIWNNREVKEVENFKSKLINSQFNPELVDFSPDSQKEDVETELRRQIQKLEEQLVWATHAAPSLRQGGTVTIVSSDDHFTDRGHMLRSYKQLVEKTIILLKQYNPKKIISLKNGDMVAGRGIYKEQNMDSILQFADEQIRVAAVKGYEYDQLIKQNFPEAEHTVLVTKGNHDRAMGEPLAPVLVEKLRLLGVNAKFCGDSVIVNLADNGYYYLYAEHGYGYSQHSPSAPKWLDDMKDKLLRLTSKGYYGDRRIRRITHGHTHWFQLGMERILDHYFDTTGGCQRNERILLGKNIRPSGWVVYISPEGFNSILDPIGVQPDKSVQDEDVNDPYLFKANMEDCADYLIKYNELMHLLDVYSISEPEGR